MEREKRNLLDYSDGEPILSLQDHYEKNRYELSLVPAARVIQVIQGWRDYLAVVLEKEIVAGWRH
jgi:hypothetical protein